MGKSGRCRKVRGRERAVCKQEFKIINAQPPGVEKVHLGVGVEVWGGV